jgi:hypothetical protein
MGEALLDDRRETQISGLKNNRKKEQKQVQRSDGLTAKNRCQLVPVEGLEPPLPCENQILSLARLPFRHTGTNQVGLKCHLEGRVANQR